MYIYINRKKLEIPVTFVNIMYYDFRETQFFITVCLHEYRKWSGKFSHYNMRTLDRQKLLVTTAN